MVLDIQKKCCTFAAIELYYTIQSKKKLFMIAIQIKDFFPAHTMDKGFSPCGWTSFFSGNRLGGTFFAFRTMFYPPPLCADNQQFTHFLSGDFRTLSEPSDFFPETSGRFPSCRISFRRLQDAFRAVGFLPGDFRTLSEPSDCFPETSGRFPSCRIASQRLRDAFRAVGLLAKNCLFISNV
jgi:hypothetical protein